MGRSVWGGVGLAIILLSGGCEQVPRSAKPPFTTVSPPPCHIDAPDACRVGCDTDEPKKLLDVAPDLSGIDLSGLHGFEIAEILIDDHGDVKDVCLMHGVRQDVDLRAVAAIRRWRFEPVTLRHSTPPRVPVSIVMTVAVSVGRNPVERHSSSSEIR
jgi:hypothetical protein